MSLEIIDLSTGVDNVSTSKNPEDLSAQINKLKETFSVNTDLSALTDLCVKQSEYYNDCKPDLQRSFGEKNSLLYTVKFSTYNTEFCLKLLTFQYENSYEILKVDIEPENERYRKELEYCCNSLKRRRNLNLLFKTLIEFSKALESRRLIVEIILARSRYVNMEENVDGGVIIMYRDLKLNIRLGIFWSVVCHSDFEINDVIEVYYNNIELPNLEDIKKTLVSLTHPQLNFREKYHTWKYLLSQVCSNTKEPIKTARSHRSRNKPEKSAHVSDSDVEIVEVVAGSSHIVVQDKTLEREKCDVEYPRISISARSSDRSIRTISLIDETENETNIESDNLISKSLSGSEALGKIGRSSKPVVINGVVKSSSAGRTHESPPVEILDVKSKNTSKVEREGCSSEADCVLVVSDEDCYDKTRSSIKRQRLNNEVYLVSD
ncbi:uncharacterized protein LOC132700666 [Cylas formicarius]|uniref:uncharacterized protein LOC132700666 n=1 Tax=Cylas formicarius TaxID=197179 RepID=UPI0029587B82|nr:uncharacterized protein LOC132700666 [Cylas formicarius]